MTIWKFPLKTGTNRHVLMPSDAKVLSAHMQGDVITLWALVDPWAEQSNRLFHVIGTGWEIDDEFLGHKFIGTVQHQGLVFHVWED